jgi:acyl-CoA dehydrogenase
MAKLDHAMTVTLKAEATERKVRQAIRDQKIPKKKGLEALDEAKKAGVITAEEYALVKESSAIRADAIQVDDFSEADFKANYVGAPSNGHFKSASI